MGNGFAKTLSKEELLKDCAKLKFLETIGDNEEETKEQLRKWLIRDFECMIHYVDFMEHVYDLAPQEDKEFWDGMAEDVDEEIEWYDKALKAKNIPTEDLKEQAEKCIEDSWIYEFMDNKKSYLAHVTAAYALELSSYRSWSTAKNPQAKRFAERWGDDAAKEIIEDLAKLVDKAAKNASEAELNEAREVWKTILVAETEYYNEEDEEVPAPSS